MRIYLSIASLNLKYLNTFLRVKAIKEFKGSLLPPMRLEMCTVS